MSFLWAPVDIVILKIRDPFLDGVERDTKRKPSGVGPDFDRQPFDIYNMVLQCTGHG